MYMAGRTRTASSPSRMRIASTPYPVSAWSGFVGCVSFMSLVARSVASGATHRAAAHVVDAPLGAEALRPAGPRPLLVQLGVQIVEQRHRGSARLLAIDPQAGNGESQKMAAGLARR